VSDVRPAAGKKAAGQTGKESLIKRITNIEQGITNIEVRYFGNIFLKKD
jgi:hypothetical protein